MILEGKIDAILDLLIEGQTFRRIADEMGCSISTLHEYLSLADHAPRTSAALALSAAQYADKAEEVLQDAEGTLIELSRARELAQHYRWKASKRDPKRYGEKVAVNHSGQVTNVNVTAQEAREISKALEDEV